MSELLALADRCEAATGADRLLDYLIRAAIGKGVSLHNAVRVSPASQSGYETVHYANGGVSQGSMPPAYTASLDAAMTLVPESQDWLIDVRKVRRTYAACSWVAHEPDGQACRADAATPALALTAAALRVRVQIKGDAL